MDKHVLYPIKEVAQSDDKTDDTKPKTQEVKIAPNAEVKQPLLMITAPYTETKTIEIKDKMPQDEEKKANKKKLKKA